MPQDTLVLLQLLICAASHTATARQYLQAMLQAAGGLGGLRPPNNLKYALLNNGLVSSMTKRVVSQASPPLPSPVSINMFLSVWEWGPPPDSAGAGRPADCITSNHHGQKRCTTEHRDCLFTIQCFPGLCHGLSHIQHNQKKKRQKNPKK